MTDKKEVIDQSAHTYKAVSLKVKGCITIDDRLYSVVSTELEDGKCIESYIPSVFDKFEINLKGNNDNINEPKGPTINKGFSLKGYESIVFNVKLNQCKQSKTSRGEVYVKLGIRIKNKYISYQEFQKVFSKLQKLLSDYKVPYQKTMLTHYILPEGMSMANHYKNPNDVLHYTFDKDKGDEKSITLEYRENQAGLIDTESVNMLIPGCFRLDGQSNAWVVDENLVYNIINDFLKSSEEFIIIFS